MSDHETLSAAAIDLGASSGRVVLGRVGQEQLEADVVHRFPNQPYRDGGRLCWNLGELVEGIVHGVAEARAMDNGLESLGVDSWAVDYGLLDAGGALLGPPVHYRDARTDGIMDAIRQRFGDRRLYETTGLQFLPVNTLFQLLAEDPDRLDRAAIMLLIPDLLTHALTGAGGAERTNASTTQLYDVSQGAWAVELAADVGIPRRILPDLHDPGDSRGRLLPEIRARVGDDGRVQVRAVGSHDTASAVAAVPAVGDRFAYISCGTWSLVGVELDAPILTAASAAANFTNEVGVDGTIRYLRNVIGLWPLQECVREWTVDGGSGPAELSGLLEEAGREPALRSVFDPESAELLSPGDMPARIRKLCAGAGQPVPETPAAVVRSIMDSLAIGHARAIRDAARLSGRGVDVVHLVGGGSQNRLLAQLTADATGMPVLAGPAEATALGNLLVQARAAGVLAGRSEARALVAATQSIERFEPNGTLDWSPWVAA